MLTTGLSEIVFIMLKYVHSNTRFFWTLQWRDAGFCQRHFWICWDDYVVSVFEVIYAMNHIYRFTNVVPSLHLWNETNFIMMYGLFFFYMILNLVCKYFIENFYVFNQEDQSVIFSKFFLRTAYIRILYFHHFQLNFSPTSSVSLSNSWSLP